MSRAASRRWRLIVCPAGVHGEPDLERRRQGAQRGHQAGGDPDQDHQTDRRQTLIRRQGQGAKAHLRGHGTEGNSRARIVDSLVHIESPLDAYPMDNVDAVINADAEEHGQDANIHNVEFPPQ